MKGSVGIATNIYGSILPRAVKIAKIVKLSKEGKQRLKWLDYYFKQKNVSLTCRHFGIPRSLFYKWFNRWKRLGIKGLETQSRKPCRVRQREISWEVQVKIEQLRRKNPVWSKYKIAHILKRDEDINISPSSVNRIYHDRNLFWNNSKKRKTSSRAWKIKRIRAPKDLRGANPGSLIEIDLKVLNYLGQTFYQFTAIDTHTKIKFIKVYSSKSAKCGQRYVKELLTFYPFPINHINSDNGGEFLAECHLYLTKRRITHFFSQAYTPKDNPMVENTIKADKYEFWIWNNLASTVKELNQKAKFWMNKFNNYRPHQALQYMTPMEYYQTNFVKTKVSSMY